MREYNDGQYEPAAQHLQSALQYEPDAADTNFFLGICHLREGHPEKAIDRLRIPGNSRKSHYFQSAHFYLAKAEIQRLNLPGAENELQTALSVPGSLTTESKRLLARVQELRAEIQKNQ